VVSYKNGEFLDQLRDSQLLKNYSLSRIYLSPQHTIPATSFCHMERKFTVYMSHKYIQMP